MEEEQEKTKVMNENDHTIFVGNKPFMNYVTGVVMQFTTQGADEVIVKARGKFISKAVDISEVASKRFLEGQAKVTNVKIDSEEFKNKEGKQVRVSTIEVYLKK
ncbi:DNA-binding protein Alba [archaeon]|nr:DNA-binding protein Alba [archaeon]|tara:strand:- start:1340 stop:1651 length:312 start_codon:yes stop_codon:yes gene_type:complete